MLHLTTKSFQLIAIALILATGAISLQAAVLKPKAPAVTPSEREAQLTALRSAYMTLFIADHDYKGHRVLAMHAIEKACDLLGQDIRGDGKGHEKQTISDAQLAQARTLVDGVLASVIKGQEPKIAAHLDQAVKEIDIALTIK